MRLRLADGASDMSFEKILTHRSRHIPPPTKASQAPQRLGLPASWARPCPLASRQPGPDQHSHGKEAGLGVGGFQFCSWAECLNARLWN